MEELENGNLKLDVHSNEIRSEDLQEIMLIVKKNNNFTEQIQEIHSDILAKLWGHLTFELPEFDDQLLCCTCFYSVLSNSQNQALYLNKALKIINDEIMLKQDKSDEKRNSSVAVSLCYGMFQSSYFMHRRITPQQELKSVLKATFDLMMLMANEYSQHTFIVFKTITAFKKVIETPLQNILFNTERKIILLNLINHNWENPITGVRNLNRILFQMLLQVIDNDMYEKVLNEINGFYWNKAKFLMLTEIIEHSNGNVEELVLKNKWIHGLTNSLINSGLVSAGADMYYAILKKLVSENSWIKLFLTDVLNIFSGLSFKSIANFSNYWCLTTFKKFPTVVQVLINELQNADATELRLYSLISVLKQANKLGLIKKRWLVTEYTYEESMVLSCLEHCNASIRMLAFEIICVSQTKSLPSEIEFQQVLKFLQNNVNSDSTLLRLSMLNSLTHFFITVHTSFLNYYKNDTDKKELCNFHEFCKHLQIFVIESLNLDGNYQRKITTVKIAYLILKHFNDLPRRKQKQTREQNYSLIGYMKENGYWLLNSIDYVMKLINLLKDPASDVQECILDLLLEFYLLNISDTITLNYLIEESLKCIKSKLFFEISCGLNIFRLIINIITKKKQVAAKFKNIEDIFYFAYNEMIAEYNAKINVVESIARGKQLHSFLSLLCIIFEANIKNSYHMVLPVDTMITLQIVLKDISNQFAWQEETNTSSDFSIMNDMVLSLIESSSFKENTNDQTKISGLYQIVLNCLWLNVKASCELAAILIQHNKDNTKLCEESLNIIAHVLETSRHKGAIEAAGAILGQSIRYLTSPGIEPEVSKLPMSILKRKLNELLLETTKMSSVTRRGAGLSIMIHRIVSNDTKKGKPLFHYFMKTILNACNTSQKTCDNHEEDNDEKDLPKAIYIHFLTRIVTDSSLASDMMYYSAELAELSFGNLTNPHWQIRNAALQLYGALIPKLIGQKKPSGTDDVIISSVACDEFRTHSIKLWDSIIKQLKNDIYEDIIQGHSYLVPILNTLANIALRYNFSYDLNNQMDSELNLLPNTFALLGSPIYTIRRLTSKLILNIYSFEIILTAIAKVTISSENQLHGILLVVGNCYKVYSNVELYKNQLDNIRNVYGKLLMRRHVSYLCRWRLEKLFTEEIPEVTVVTIKDILSQGKTKQHEPGVFLCINHQIKKSLKYMPWNILPEVMLLLLNTHDFEMYCEIIVQRIKNSIMVPENVLLDVSKILLSSASNTRTSMFWRTLYCISHRIHFDIHIIPTCYLQEQLSGEISYKTRYMVPFATRLFAIQRNNENLLILSRKIFLLCNPESNDIDMRYIAAMANNELAFTFPLFSDDIKINAIKSACILLQDEEEDVRNLGVIFYKSLAKQNNVKHPFYCLNELLKKEFLFAQLNEPGLGIQKIFKDLLEFIDSIGTSKCNGLNPFASDSKNIYLEVNVFKQLLINLNESFE